MEIGMSRGIKGMNGHDYILTSVWIVIYILSLLFT